MKKVILFAIPLFCLATGLAPVDLWAQARPPAKKAADGGIQQDKEDSITLTDSRVLRGTISRDDYKGVVIKVKGKDETVPILEINDVYYKDEPSTYKNGMDAYRKRDFVAAKTALATALAEKDKTKTRDWIDQYAGYHIARCLMEVSQYKDAAEAFKKLRADVPDTRFVEQSYVDQVECLLRAKDMAGARAVVDDAGASAKVDAGLKNSLRINLAESLYRQKQFEEARNEFMKLSLLPDPLIAANAADGELRCLQGLNKPDEIERFCEAKAGSPNPAVALIASAELGRLLVVKAKDAAGARKALTMILGVIVKYLPPKDTAAARHYGKAQFHLGECYEKLAAFYPAEDTRKRFLEWAAAAYRDAVGYQSDQQYRSEARKRLDALTGKAAKNP